MKYYIETDENNVIASVIEVTGDHTAPGVVDPNWIEVSEDPINKIGHVYDSETGTITKPSSLLESEIREKRNSLLSLTDHYALQDVTMTTEMQTYRQDLRDITEQAGFPNSVTWPTKPGE